MRVLILSQYFWPESFRINTLVDALEAVGAHVTVLTGQPNYPDGVVFAGYRAFSVRRDHYGSATEVFRVPIVPRARASALRLASNYLSFVLSASLIGPWLLRGRKIDVILVYAPSPIVQAIPGMVLKRLKGAKLVTWVQDLWPESLESTGFVTNGLLLRFVAGMVRWIYRANDLLFGQSRGFVAAIQPLAGRTPVEYFPNPGDSPTLPLEERETPLILPPGFNIVFAGNLGTVQALDTVLDAATLLRDEPDVRFVLLGSGSRLAWLSAEIERRALTNVLMAGRFDADAMPGILSQAGAVLVSLKKGDILAKTIPAKVQAYLGSSRPILASLDGEGAELVVAAGAGFASPAEDPRALADAVLRLKGLSHEDRRRMGEAGRAYYDRHFQPRVLAEWMVSRFRKLTGDASSR